MRHLVVIDNVLYWKILDENAGCYACCFKYDICDEIPCDDGNYRQALTEPWVEVGNI